MLVRTVSGFIGAVILAVVLVFKDTVLFNLMLAVLSGIATFEIIRACDLLKYKLVSAFGILFSFVSVAVLEIDKIGSFSQSQIKGIVSILFVFGLLLSMLFSNYKIKFNDVCIVFASSLFISYGFSSYSYIRNLVGQHNKDAVIYVLILCACGAFIADTGAYFVGSTIGKHKLCPTISPKKSVEGFVGGVVLDAVAFPLLALVFSMINTSLRPNFAVLFIMGALCAVAGCIGDLFASYIKRSTGIKDFGKIMPGHGGVLDRFDSFLAVIPLMYVLLQISYKFVPVF